MSGIEGIMQSIKTLEIGDKVITKVIKEAKGPPALMVIEWNRQTRELFRKGHVPKQGRRYCWKCIRHDGKRMYFILDDL